MNYEDPNEYGCVDEYGFPPFRITDIIWHRYLKFEGVIPKNEEWNLQQNTFDLYISPGSYHVFDASIRHMLDDCVIEALAGFYTGNKLVYMTNSKLKVVTHACDEKLACVPTIVFIHPGTLFSEDNGCAMGKMNWMETTFNLFTTLIHGYKLSSSMMYQKVKELFDDDDYDEYNLAAEYGWDIDGVIALYDGVIKSGNQRLIDMLFKKNHELNIKIYAVIFDYLTNNNLTNMTLLWPREIYEELTMFYNSIGEFEKQIILMDANRTRSVDWSL